jgi:hypothetical protein
VRIDKSVPIIVVRRDAVSVFRTLRENFLDPVIWDRRPSERRRAQRRRGSLASTFPGRRRVERRRRERPTWTTYGFLLLYGKESDFEPHTE